MSRQLKRDVLDVNNCLKADPASGAIQQVSLDEACVNLVVSKDSKKLRLTIYYLDADNYPHTACLASTEDSSIEGVLQTHVNEKHESEARLQEVLASICAALSLECPPAITAGGGIRGGGNGGDQPEDMDADQEDQAADSDGSEEEEEAYDMAEQYNENLMVEILQKATKWQATEQKHAPPPLTEEEEEALEKPAADAGLTAEEKMAFKRQMFNPKEAYAMLSKELMDIMKGEVDFLTADTVDDDVYKWDLRITKCENNTALCKALEELKQRTGDGSIRLQVTFKRGLHPFFPAAVSLLSPRFEGPVAGALASHPMLQLSNWDPWRPVRDLATHLRDFIQQVGHVDVPATLRSFEAGLDSPYSEVERSLVRLEALTGMLPACIDDYKELYSARDAGVDAARIEALKPTSKRAKTDAESRSKNYWASGTGYGHSGRHGASSEVWDARAAEAAQAAHDAELQGIATRLGQLLHERFQRADGSAAAPIDIDDEEAAADSAVEDLAAVRCSCLIPVLMQQLGTATFTDMCSRAAFYESLLQVANELSQYPPAAPLFAARHAISEHSPSRDASAVFANLKGQAQQFLRVFVPAAAAGDGAGPSSAAGTSAVGAAAEEAERAREEEAVSVPLAKLIMDLTSRISALVEGLQAAEQQAGASSSRRSAAAAAGSSGSGRQTRGRAQPATQQPQQMQQELAAVYEEQMKKWQMDTTAGLDKSHLHRASASKEGVQPRPRMIRVGKELASLTATLPLNTSSSVFVRVDENNLALWRALITGPDGTPYSGGCFLFDMYFPPQYPSQPPQVLLRTTGGGSVRFNPNLYNCGKVCLSLLGTWSGGKGESWDPACSSMLQVLVSIQSLILVDDPFFNEPGYEASMHTERGRQQSRDYNANIQEQTMKYAIEEQLRAPAPEFRAVMHEHFRLQRSRIVDTCQKWVTETQEFDPGRAKRMQTVLTQIEKLLAK